MFRCLEDVAHTIHAECRSRSFTLLLFQKKKRNSMHRLRKRNRQEKTIIFLTNDQTYILRFSNNRTIDYIFVFVAFVSLHFFPMFEVLFSSSSRQCIVPWVDKKIRRVISIAHTRYKKITSFCIYVRASMRNDHESIWWHGVAAFLPKACSILKGTKLKRSCYSTEMGFAATSIENFDNSSSNTSKKIKHLSNLDTIHK